MDTKDEFEEVREAVRQNGFVDPLVGLPSIYKALHQPEPNWLEVVKLANKQLVALTSHDVLMEFTDHHFTPLPS